MTEEHWQVITCPTCEAPLHVDDAQETVLCATCGTESVLPGHLCPLCGTYHADEAVFCRQCDTPLARNCPYCHHRNWSGATLCVDCGRPVDVIEAVTLHHEAGRRQRQQLQKAQIRTLRQQEGQTAAKRRAELDAAEEERRVFVGDRLRQRRNEENRLLFVAIGGITIFLVALLVYLATALLF